MDKEDLEEYRKRFKESDACKWYLELSYEQKSKLVQFVFEDAYYVHDSIHITYRGIRRLHEMYLKGSLDI